MTHCFLRAPSLPRNSRSNWRAQRASRSFAIAFPGCDLTLEDYLNRRPVTGFLIAKDNTILLERYQYGRTDTDRLTSFSMAKSVVALLIGIAVKEGAIRSVDDLAETYVPGLKDTEYGRTPIKALLLMASGVAFSEDYANRSSDIYKLARLTIEQDPGGSLAAVKQFNTRRAAPGARFSYSSAETVVLGLVLAAATKRTVSDYAAEKLWQPLGAEADATWIIDATGQEITFAYVNAVLRDWARLGLMLANRGNWQGKTVVPEDWLTASAANALPTDPPLAKYGYQIWYSEDTSRFSLRGLRGQYVLVDPALKLVLVQTALSRWPARVRRVACSMERAASTVSVAAVQAARPSSVRKVGFWRGKADINGSEVGSYDCVLSQLTAPPKR